jgi:hypothetical protein
MYIHESSTQTNRPDFACLRDYLTRLVPPRYCPLTTYMVPDTAFAMDVTGSRWKAAESWLSGDGTTQQSRPTQSTPSRHKTERPTLSIHRRATQKTSATSLCGSAGRWKLILATVLDPDSCAQRRWSIVPHNVTGLRAQLQET